MEHSESLVALIYFTDVEEEYEVKFLRRSGWGGFTFPNVADIYVIWFLNFPVRRVLEELQGLGDSFHFLFT